MSTLELDQEYSWGCTEQLRACRRVWNRVESSMKFFISTLLITASFMGTAVAGPRLVFDTVATNLITDGKEKVVGHFHFIARDGEKTVLPVEDQRYSVTPTLRDNGTVDLSQTVTHPMQRGADVTLGPQQQNAKLGEKYSISYGSFTYCTKVSLAK